MSENQQQTFDQQGEYQPQGSGCSPVLKILGIGCLVFILVGIGCGIYVFMNFKKLAAGAAGFVVKSAIAESGMPAEQQKEFTEQIDRVVNAYKSGEISDEEMERIVDELSKSPLIPMTMISIADQKYVQPSGLLPDEKTEGTKNLQRFGKGILDKKIGDPEIGKATGIITVTDKDGKQELKESLTDDEVRELLSTVKEASDAVGIPNENFQINPADELKQAIDKALNQGEPTDTE